MGSNGANLFAIFALLILLKVSPISANITTLPSCKNLSVDPNRVAKDFYGRPTQLWVNTPYVIKNMETGLVFAHRTNTIDLNKLSHWWELIPIDGQENVYELTNMDPQVQEYMPLIERKIKIGVVGMDTFSIYPLTCLNFMGNESSRTGSYPDFIYFDYLDEYEIDQVDCALYSDTIQIEAKHEYQFVSVAQHLSSKDITFSREVVKMSNLNDDAATHLATSDKVESAVVRNSIIQNCGEGDVIQEFKYSIQSSVLSVLSVAETFGVQTIDHTSTSVGAKVGFKVLDVVGISVGGSMEWAEVKADKNVRHEDTTLSKEQVVGISASEKIRVAGCSCVNVTAYSAALNDIEIPVELEVELKIVGGNASRFIAGDPTEFLKLMKFSGLEKKYDYDSAEKSIRYTIQSQIKVTTLILLRAEIQQVICDLCPKKRENIAEFGVKVCFSSYFSNYNFIVNTLLNV